MKLAIVMVLWVGATAAAKEVRAAPTFAAIHAEVVDPDATHSGVELVDAIAHQPAAAQLAKCPYKSNSHVLAWLVFDAGKVVTADAAGSKDRALEACVTKALKSVKLADTKARIGAIVELAATP